MRSNPFIDLLTWFGSTRAGAWTIINLGTPLDRWLIPLTDGKFNSTIAWPCLLLTTKGAKTGLPRTVSLVYLQDGDSLVLIGSKGGNLNHPSWYVNLKANPEVEVLLDGTSYKYNASDADGEEYDRLWECALDVYSGYSVYKERAGDRKIPVVILKPISS